MAEHQTAAQHDREPLSPTAPTAGPRYVKTGDLRSEHDQDTCLRPLGLCELGGCCDTCWYRPDHPRFKKK